MPAPLAKGLIISLSILIAAGLAVYDNPQVREWIEESRRKLAIALHNIGDEIQPRPSNSRTPSNDASTREDDSPDATERRRRAREEIMERGRMMEEKRRERQAQRGNSFDNMVDQEGRLREKAEASASASATGKEVGAGELRNRQTTAAGVALGSMAADPFADDSMMNFTDEKAALKEETSNDNMNHDSPKLDTQSASEFMDLTPSASTPVSSTPTDRFPGEEAQAPYQSTDFHSIHEWNERSTASFYSPPESESHFQEAETRSNNTSTTASIIGSADYMSEADVVSERGDIINTPDSWTEVGSVVSEEGM